MEGKFISHPDYYDLEPIDVFHKEIINGSRAYNRNDEDNYWRKAHPDFLRNKHILYRKKTTLNKFKNATLKITADDYYKLYINGRYVTEGPAPSYPFGYFYNEIDVTAYLKEGENTFAIHTYYQGRINHVWVSSDLKQMLYFSLSVDGETQLVSDEKWKCKYHTGYTDAGFFGYETAYAERYDASAPEAKFYEEDFDDSDFVYAKINTRQDNWSLVKQATPNIHVYDVIPEKIEMSRGRIFFALPSEMAGSVTFKAKGKKGDEIILHYAEELNEDGSVRFDMRCYCRYEEFMLLSGGEDTLMQFDYKAFRYVELLFPENVEIYDIKMRVRHYPFTQKHFYKTKNEKLSKVLDLCINTIKYGTQEQYLDCPTREKGSYLGDLMVSGRAEAILSGDLTLLKQVIENFARGTVICPGMMACTANALMQEIADYSLEFPAILPWIYSIDGDVDFVRRMYPCALNLYKYFKGFENKDGLLEDMVEKWNLVDWPQNLRDGYDFPNLTNPIQKGLGPHNVLNALWYGCKLALEEITKILGINEDFETEKTKRGFISSFYSEETGLFVDRIGSLHSAVHSNILPLLFGLCDEDENLKERLISYIRKKKLSSMGVYMAYFALAAIKRAGRLDICEELATDESAWLNMIKEGATTTFEAWGKEQKVNTSLCHPWATAPLVIFADGYRVY